MGSEADKIHHTCACIMNLIVYHCSSSIAASGDQWYSMEKKRKEIPIFTKEPYYYFREVCVQVSQYNRDAFTCSNSLVDGDK